MSIEFNDKVAIVTGAGGGIGGFTTDVFLVSYACPDGYLDMLLKMYEGKVVRHKELAVCLLYLPTRWTPVSMKALSPEHFWCGDGPVLVYV